MYVIGYLYIIEAWRKLLVLQIRCTYSVRYFRKSCLVIIILLHYFHFFDIVYILEINLNIVPGGVDTVLS